MSRIKLAAIMYFKNPSGVRFVDKSGIQNYYKRIKSY